MSGGVVTAEEFGDLAQRMIHHQGHVVAPVFHDGAEENEEHNCYDGARCSDKTSGAVPLGVGNKVGELRGASGVGEGCKHDQ